MRYVSKSYYMLWIWYAVVCLSAEYEYWEVTYDMRVSICYRRYLQDYMCAYCRFVIKEKNKY